MEKKMRVERLCRNCEFYSNGMCFEHGERHFVKEDQGCDVWGASYDYQMQLENNAPWYIRRPYRKGNAYGKDLLRLLDMDFVGEPIDVDIYTLIENVYGLNPDELAAVLNVSVWVLDTAQLRGTPNKRKESFSSILNIPSRYFERVTTCDFETIRKCGDVFWKLWKERMPFIRQNLQKEQEEKERRDADIIKSVVDEREKMLLERYSNVTLERNDLYKDYSRRRYVLKVQLQEDDFVGHLYFEEDTGGFGLLPLLRYVDRFLNELSGEDIKAYFDEEYVINDMGMKVSKDEEHLEFVLRNASQQELSKYICPADLGRYIVGMSIVDVAGVGKKKEKHKCASCSYFSQTQGNAKGFCAKRNAYVYQSRVFCKQGLLGSEK